ncbi:Predicted membrane protein [Rubrivivax sp. A210]|uniref:Mpo1 family 2-hydroxy fatty acid dioxygenase n=1 Tax=Rubrivivax sp. A210 TaxID=2772301 RepID=UPI00191A9AA0|nr:Mpo1-like protein [Rubrivivax sp. A210]CAD5373814.1 Predicted membrane protein [Rubrivivax sp. A210]
MASPFRPAVDLLAHYAGHHRDRRNIVTHLVGVPLIVLGLGVLLSRPALALGGLALTPAWIAFALVAAWYLTRGRLGIGAATVLAMGALVALAHQLGRGATVGFWLGCGLGLFFCGSVVQLIGHYYEGRKPAFADDGVGALVAPMFVMMEMLARAGCFKGLIAEIERRAGPTMLRDLAEPAPATR